MLTKMTALIAKLPAAYRPLASAWSPGIVKIIIDTANGSLDALYARLSGITPAKLDEIHAQMTGDELAAESVALEAMFKEMAQASYDSQQLGQQMIKAVLTATIGLAFSVIGF
jgi:hypothetical protein